MPDIADAILPPVNEPREDVTDLRYSDYDRDPVMFWNAVGLRMNQLTHTVGGPHGGPTMSSRALGILHLAIHDACFAIPQNPTYPTYLNAHGGPAPSLPLKPAGALSTTDAVAGAAHQILWALYGDLGSFVSRAVRDRFNQELTEARADFVRLVKRGHPIDLPSFEYGRAIAREIAGLLMVKAGEIGAGDTVDGVQWQAREGRFEFRHEPTHPVRLRPVDPARPDGELRPVSEYHGPYYGTTTKPFAVTRRHYIGDPPFDRNAAEIAEYEAAFKEVYALGGAPTLPATTRTPDQTVAGKFWAYDGANLIGTPPRLYNQILRVVAAANPKGDGHETAHYARLFALANAAMGDAGVMAWQEKYRYRYWRPLSGVREDQLQVGGGADAGSPHLNDKCDPFWLTLGAPATNTSDAGFKPPFPAYPSGHATFGAAAFQIARLFFQERDQLPFGEHEPDTIAFAFVSEELNGKSRDLDGAYEPSRPITDQPGNVRTRVNRSFESLWRAIYENGASRVYLGVHWIFDAFSGADVYTDPDNGDYTHKAPDQIRYPTTGPSTRNAIGENQPPAGNLPIGGVPLGLAIANDIYAGGLKPSPVQPQMPGAAVAGAAIAAVGPAQDVASRDAIPRPQNEQYLRTFSNIR